MPRILVIDDERGLREGVATYLRRLGHVVVEAEDGRRGFEALQIEPFDLVITDINMPDMDGIEVVDQLRQVTGGCPVIAMSGGGLFDKELLLANAEMLGAVSTLAKPFDLHDLGAAVGDAIAGSGRREG
ncbi:MAG: response regulator [Gemmatimonadales bacterium]